jgi:23S rRNA pseudouridine1911/1915/1917 synthase
MNDNLGDIINFDITLEEGEKGARLDRYLASNCGDISRSRLKALILGGTVTINGDACLSPSHKIKDGDTIEVIVPPPIDADPEPENIPLDIVYEDDDLLVINKAVGMVVHPGAGNWDGTLVNALLYHCGDELSGIGGVKRPGIVHRLDKDTSGLMVVAKSDKAHKGLADQLADRSLSRHYQALVWKPLNLPKGKVDEPIGRHPTQRIKMAINNRNGRSAVTHYMLIEKFGDCASLIECRLESGRTHQIRVHMGHIGHPLVGDPVYGIQKNAAMALLKKDGCSEENIETIMNFPRQALHAWKLRFIHPITLDERSFEAELPEDMASLINLFKTDA